MKQNNGLILSIGGDVGHYCTVGSTVEVATIHPMSNEFVLQPTGYVTPDKLIEIIKKQSKLEV